MATGHFRAGLAELLLDVALIDLGRLSQAGARKSCTPWEKTRVRNALTQASSGNTTTDCAYPTCGGRRRSGQAMESIWQELFDNLAATAFFVSAWAHFHPRAERISGISRAAVFGMWMGVTASVSMLLSVQVSPGVYFDFRNALVSMSGLFGGPIAAALTVLIAGVHRILMGGAGTLFGLVHLVVAAVFSSLVYLSFKERQLGVVHIIAYATVLSAIGLALRMTPLSPLGTDILQITQLPVATIGFLATVVAGIIMIKIRDYAVERDLLRAALEQSPDFYYIKDRQSRFRIVNQSVASHNGFAKPVEMTGLTDADIASPTRSRQLLAEEQEIMASGSAIAKKEEVVETESGTRWYSTSKTPLANAAGHVIGLVGVTHDITERKRLEEELASSRNLLAHAMREMSDGLAMFDHNGRLAFANDQYRSFFPITGPLQVPGADIRDILTAAIELGEAVGIPESERSAWIEQRVSSLRYDNEQDVRTSAGSWLIIRTRVAPDGSSLVVVADQTAMKEAEVALRQLNEQLKILADTDGLTGLANRRAFDAALAIELAQTQKSHQPLSLILIDVDRFKAYNDHYGHSTGDQCLRIFGECLKQTKARPNDVAARYGGEEFALILPQTDEAGAMAVAQRFQLLLRERDEPHLASEKGVLTASLGIAVCAGDVISPKALINQADEALYHAKASGRDCMRVFGQDGQRASA
jgi:diguanylate cyclase (GGDEF)-like protein/PAS domain S-box-containing protein